MTSVRITGGMVSPGARGAAGGTAFDFFSVMLMRPRPLLGTVAV